MIDLTQRRPSVELVTYNSNNILPIYAGSFCDSIMVGDRFGVRSRKSMKEPFNVTETGEWNMHARTARDKYTKAGA